MNSNLFMLFVAYIGIFFTTCILIGFRDNYIGWDDYFALFLAIIIGSSSLSIISFTGIPVFESIFGSKEIMIGAILNALFLIVFMLFLNFSSLCNKKMQTLICSTMKKYVFLKNNIFLRNKLTNIFSVCIFLLGYCTVVSKLVQ